MGPVLTIGQLARNFGLNAKTLRYYETLGLIQPERRPGSGYRLYREGDIQRLRFVRSAKNLGFPLKAIAAILTTLENSVEPCTLVNNLVDSRIEQLNEQIATLTRVRTALVQLKAVSPEPCEPNAREHCVYQQIERGLPSLAIT